MLIIFGIIFLFFHALSPLNKLLREDEAQNLYNQALDFYETKDYESAIGILNRLVESKLFSGERGFWGYLGDTEASKKAQEMLPKWEFEYAEYLMEEGKFVEGWEQLFYALGKYPELEIDASSSKMKEWTMEYARNNDEVSQINLKEGTVKNLGGSSEIVIINDSPRSIHVYTCGSISTCITLEANPESSIKGFVFSWQGPSNRNVQLTLNPPAGHLEMAIAAGKKVFYGDLNLESNTSYELWFYIQSIP
jgi:hypothetical protein